MKQLTTWMCYEQGLLKTLISSVREKKWSSSFFVRRQNLKLYRFVTENEGIMVKVIRENQELNHCGREEDRGGLFVKIIV